MGVGVLERWMRGKFLRREVQTHEKAQASMVEMCGSWTLKRKLYLWIICSFAVADVVLNHIGLVERADGGRGVGVDIVERRMREKLLRRIIFDILSGRTERGEMRKLGIANANVWVWIV